MKPAWVVDSVAAGKLLPWSGYRVMGGDGVGAGQRVIAWGGDSRGNGGGRGGGMKEGGNGGIGRGNWLRRSGGYRDQTDASWYTKVLLQKRDEEVDYDGIDNDGDIEEDGINEVDGEADKEEEEDQATDAEEALLSNIADEDLIGKEQHGLFNAVGDDNTSVRNTKKGHGPGKALIENSTEIYNIDDDMSLLEQQIKENEKRIEEIQQLQLEHDLDTKDDYESLDEADLQTEAVLLEQRHSISPFVTPTKVKAEPSAAYDHGSKDIDNNKNRNHTNDIDRAFVTKKADTVLTPSKLTLFKTSLTPDQKQSKNPRQQQQHQPSNPAQYPPPAAPALIPDYRALYTGEDPSPQRHFPNGQAAQTAEEHNAIILSDPRLLKSTAVNPDFLQQYYRESRLHHLSTWKAELKAKMQARAAAKTSSQQALSQQRRQNLVARAGGGKEGKDGKRRRYILHVDFDSFFAAVSLVTGQPAWMQERPAVVAHGRGKGSEIASCNYPARKYGIKNGMWMREALDKCPDLNILPYDFPAYERASEAFYEAILAVDGAVVQSVSIDEALMDVSAACIDEGYVRVLREVKECEARGGVMEEREREKKQIAYEEAHADAIATSLRAEIKRDTGCDVSVGIGGNVLLAKVALRKAKPAGQYHLKPEHVIEYMGTLSLQDLPGVAWSIGGKLEAMLRDNKSKTRSTGNSNGHGTDIDNDSTNDKVAKPMKIHDLLEVPLSKLTSLLGPKTGTRIYENARGIDATPVGPTQQPPRKSVSAEVNWGIRFATQQQADDFVRNLCMEVSRRLDKEGVKGKQITLKVMRRAQDAPLAPPKHLGHGRCDVFSKSVVLGKATADGDMIADEALQIMKGFRCPAGELRGIGVQVTKLEGIGVSGGLNAEGDGSGSGGAGVGGDSMSSQKKLQFLKTDGPKTKPIQVLPPLSQPKKEKRDNRDKDDDPIEDEPDGPEPPNETEGVGEDGDADDSDSPARKPLNTLGTQFLLPTQVDASVLAELPLDVRSKLSRRQNGISRDENAVDSDDVAKGKHRETGAMQEHGAEFLNSLPAPSQLDQEVLAALPAEVRAEILSEYHLSNSADAASPTRHPTTPSKNNSSIRNAYKTDTSTGSRTGSYMRGSAGSVSPSPTPRPRTKVIPRGKLQLLPPLIPAGLAKSVDTAPSNASTRPRSAASNMSMGGSGLSGSSTSGRGRGRGRPRGRPPGIRSLPRSNPSTTGGGHPSHNYGSNTNGSNITLTQVNFVPSRPATRGEGSGHNSHTSGDDTDSNSIDTARASKPKEKVRIMSRYASPGGNTTSTESDIAPEFLAALPPDIRAEVLRNHYREQRQQQQKELLLHRYRLQQQQQQSKTSTTAATTTTTSTTMNPTDPDAPTKPKPRTYALPPKPAKPTFSTRCLSAPEDLRAAIRDWYDAFRDEVGPYREDVDALVGYLERVVGCGGGGVDRNASGENNMAKAAGLVRWLEWVVEDGSEMAAAAGGSTPRSRKTSLMGTSVTPTGGVGRVVGTERNGGGSGGGSGGAAHAVLSTSFSSLPSLPSHLSSQWGGPGKGIEKEKGRYDQSSSDVIVPDDVDVYGVVDGASFDNDNDGDGNSHGSGSYGKGNSHDGVANKTASTASIHDDNNDNDNDYDNDNGERHDQTHNSSNNDENDEDGDNNENSQDGGDNSDIMLSWPAAVERVREGVRRAVARRISGNANDKTNHGAHHGANHGSDGHAGRAGGGGLEVVEVVF